MAAPHQTSSVPIMTTSGVPVANNQTSITAGESGPIVFPDFHLIDKLSHFNRERIPERVVHAKGAGAHGIFEVTHPEITKYSKALVFSEVGKQTPCFVRFSTVGGERGSADTARDPRGFAVKFYTEDGNWDMVGNNTPVFFIRDPKKFPDFVHTQKRNPSTNCKDPFAFWDFLTLCQESNHQVTILFSDRGTPYSYRHMHGFSSHTFKLVNKENEIFYCKFHFLTNQGIKNLTNDEAVKLAGENPDFCTQDLFSAIEKENFPSWTMKVQIMNVEDAKTYRWNPLDVTKVWPHKDYPLIPVGTLTLNRNPENYFAEVEQAAFSPGHLVPGIEASEDRLLQGRIFAYSDAHRYRLGANYHQIPINCPRTLNPKDPNYRHGACYHARDGSMTVNGNLGAFPNYEPNSQQDQQGKPLCPMQNPHASITPFPVHGVVAAHDFPLTDDDFVQAGILYEKVFNEEEKEHLISNIASHANALTDETLKKKIVLMFMRCHNDYGNRLAKALNVTL